MRLSVVQTILIWENKSLNLRNFEAILVPLFGNTDLVILPEMFNSGFTMNIKAMSEPPDGETSEWMKDISKKGDFGICGSYIVRDKGKVFNRWVFSGPSEEKFTYDKRHTFSMGEEGKYITRGNERVVFPFRGFRISPYVCYDLRFPVWSRNRNDTDLILYSANWPASRQNVWKILLKARAIENQCYVAGANRIGTDGNGILYSGDSAIIDPKGEIIKSSDTGLNETLNAEISISELFDFRKKFPVLNDADNFSIIT